MNHSILYEIVEKRKKALESLKKALQIFKSQKINNNLAQKRDPLSKSLQACGRIGIISELKIASPSKGTLIKADNQNQLNTENNCEKILQSSISENQIQEIIHEMIESNVVGISVLTESEYFGGSFGNLFFVNKITPLHIPLIVKDFIIDPVQMELGKICGATNGLIIAKICDPFAVAVQMHNYELEPLIEIHDELDLEKCRTLTKFNFPFIIGINNRNLETLEIDLETTFNLIPKIRNIFGSQQMIITESGISQYRDLLRMLPLNLHGALIGTAIIQNKIQEKIKGLYPTKIPFLKICGITNQDIFLNINNSVITAFGVIVDVPTSKRNISIEEATQIFSQSPSSLLKVVVTKNKSKEEILNLFQKLHPDLLQYHGTNAMELLKEYPQTLLSKIILPIRLDEKNIETKLESIKLYVEKIFGVLLDISEGHGILFDFEKTDRFIKLIASKRVILAGGIKIENINNILRRFNPFGIDLSSSLERNGIKDPILIKNFLAQIN